MKDKKKPVRKKSSSGKMEKQESRDDVREKMCKEKERKKEKGKKEKTEETKQASEQSSKQERNKNRGVQKMRLPCRHLLFISFDFSSSMDGQTDGPTF